MLVVLVAMFGVVVKNVGRFGRNAGKRDRHVINCSGNTGSCERKILVVVRNGGSCGRKVGISD